MYHMKKTTVRDLRHNFPQVEAWLSRGEEVEVTKRGKILGTIMPAPGKPAKRKMPDFKGRMKAMFGDRIIDTASLLDYNKGRY